MGYREYEQKIGDLKDELEVLEKENLAMRNSGNCKWSRGSHNCSYPDAKYSNCYSACDKWEMDDRYRHRKESKMEIEGSEK